jgi:hypothetical protein
MMQIQMSFGGRKADMHTSVLSRLRHQPSRASVAAIGHHFVLNGAPPRLRICGIDAVCDMVCDWSVAILEEAIEDPGRGRLVRRYALEKLSELVKRAVERGYGGTTPAECDRLADAARTGLFPEAEARDRVEVPAVEDLCNHLSQAVADGVFGQMPDF